MRLATDPLSLDPLSPIPARAVADVPFADPMDLDPLSPIPWTGRTDLQAGAWTPTTESELS
jgi:hypothetical protein